MKKRLLLLLTAILLLSSMLILPIGALKLTYTPTAAYKSSIFYQRLTDIKLTGDGRRDIVNVAISQLGYHEGNSRSELDGMNYSGNKNYVEYNHANRETLDGGGSYYWCASFVTFCARQAGIPTSTIINSVSCDSFVVSFKNKGRYKSRASGYTPIAGDLIFFYDSGSNRTYASHIGIVVGTADGKVYTIEGNTTRDIVNYRSYSLSNSRIVGYAIPAYAGTTGNYGDLELKNGYAEPGIYKVTSETVNLRSEPTTSSAVLKTVKKSTELVISEASGDWGKTLYGDKTAWVSLKYLTPKDFSDYRLSYYIDNERIATTTVRAGHTASVLPLERVPTGYEFVGWSSLEGADNADFSPNDSITLTKDKALYAVLKAKPITVRFFDSPGKLLSEKVYKYGDKVEEPSAPERYEDDEFEYAFDGWDKPFIETARSDRSYTAIYREIPKAPAETTIIEATVESLSEAVTSIFSSESDPSDDSCKDSDRPINVASTTANLIVFATLILSTISFIFIKRKF